MTRPFRIIARLRNNRLITAREEMGLSVAEAAERLGVPKEQLWAYESLRQSPMTKGGEWCASARSIADAYGLGLEHLWPDVVVSYQGPIRAERALAHHESLLLSPVEEEVVAKEQSVAIRGALATLTPREEKVIRLRFGLGERQEHTQDEIGAMFGVTGGRIMQIEAKALRKLRHPSRAQAMAPFKSAT